jgi:peptidoglycan/LPS O-acetylase OafA/YrhL
LHLEAVRGLAALLVVLTHIPAIMPYFSFNSSYVIRLFSAWGTESVIIFFLLSGLVIHSSFERAPTSTGDFLANRAIRIYPILILSILLTVSIDRLHFNHAISYWHIIANIIPVSSIDATLSPLYFQANPVIWSLSFEVFFYLVFALGGIYHRKINRLFIYIWFVISLICIIAYYELKVEGVVFYLVQMTAYSDIWLIGFFVWDLKNNHNPAFTMAIFSLMCLPLISRLHLMRDTYDPFKYLLFAISSIPFFIYLCNLNRQIISGYKKNTMFLVLIPIYLIASAILIKDTTYATQVKEAYILLPFLSSLFYLKAVRRVIGKIYYQGVLPVFSYLGKLSYAIYLIHFPILILTTLLPISLGLKLIIAIIMLLSLSILLESYLQPFIKTHLKPSSNKANRI